MQTPWQTPPTARYLLACLCPCAGASAAPELAFQLQHLVQVEKEGALLTPATVTLRCPDLDTKQVGQGLLYLLVAG